EEDVDVFILRPYTIKGFSEILMRTVLGKLYPSDYVKTIREGKGLLEKGQLDEAFALFEKATTLNEKPTLAYYYKAQTEIARGNLEKAEENYSAGLKVNN